MLFAGREFIMTLTAEKSEYIGIRTTLGAKDTLQCAALAVDALSGPLKDA